jgi:hypothetical protein
MNLSTVSHRYGYGLMDALAMVQLAEQWTTVPQQRICTTEVIRVNQYVLVFVVISHIFVTVAQ